MVELREINWRYKMEAQYKTMFQAGYAYGEYWVVCGYGNTQKLAIKNLEERMVEIKKIDFPTFTQEQFQDFLNSHSYMEQSYEQRIGE